VLIFWPLGLWPPGADHAGTVATGAAFWAFATLVAWSWGRLR
jgi:hypothetical protein